MKEVKTRAQMINFLNEKILSYKLANNGKSMSILVSYFYKIAENEDVNYIKIKYDVARHMNSLTHQLQPPTSVTLSESNFYKNYIAEKINCLNQYKLFWDWLIS